MSFRTMNKWPQQKQIKYNMQYYKKLMGYTFDIHKPNTFNEKIQWYKFFYKGIDFSNITDKIKFKEYIKCKIGDGYTIPLYGYWNSIESLEKNWEKLPNEFVLKSNLSCNDGCMLIIHDKKCFDFQKEKKRIKGWLNPRNTMLNSFSNSMYESTPMILAEQFISDGNERLCDYKFFCYNGVPFCVYVDLDHKIVFYDMNWEKLDVKYDHFDNDIDVVCPMHFNEMKVLASKLSKDIPFVRVDFYDTGTRMYVGEMTFDSGNGMRVFKPNEFDVEMGKLFILPTDNESSLC